MKILNIIIILFLPILCRAQTGYSNGYVINYENDTIHGKIKDKTGLKIRFIDATGKKQKLSAYKIKAYSKAGLINYRTIDLMPKYFAEVVEDGPLSLLAMENDNIYYNNTGYNNAGLNASSTTYYLQKQNDRLPTQIFKLDFKNTMSEYFKDYKELSNLIGNKSLLYNDIKLIVRKYNEWIMDNKD